MQKHMELPQRTKNNYYLIQQLRFWRQSQRNRISNKQLPSHAYCSITPNSHDMEWMEASTGEEISDKTGTLAVHKGSPLV